MTSASTSRIYETRRRSKNQTSQGSRVDWRRTRAKSLNYLDDSEETDASTPSTSSESDTGDEAGEEATLNDAHEHTPTREGSDAEEACAVSRTRRKRSSTTILTESSSDSDSDVGGRPARKLLPKKRQNVQRTLTDSETEAAAEKVEEDEAAKTKETAAKRRERRNKLLELSKRRRSRTSTSRRRTLEVSGQGENSCDDDAGGDDDDDDSDSPDQLAQHSSEEEEEDKDSLKDFIVESDENEEEGDSLDQSKKGLFLSHHLPQFVTGSQLQHFQVVVKALLINTLDENFLKSLYDGSRTKKYALEMKSSLYYLDQRYILPRLENLKQRSRWSDRYKERVECYPKVRIVATGIRGQCCQACQLQRHSRFTVRLSGQLYDEKTLQQDEFMPDDTQAFLVGTVCANRTEVYHQLKHFKYHLLCRCRAVVKEEEEGQDEKGEEPVKDTVSRVFTKLQERGWITKEYEAFQDYLNDADYFQEEKLD